MSAESLIDRFRQMLYVPELEPGEALSQNPKVYRTGYNIAVEQCISIICQHQAALSISPDATAKARLAIGEKLAYHTNQDSAEEWLKEADEILEIVRSIMGEPGGSGDTRMEAFNSPSLANQPREISDIELEEVITRALYRDHIQSSWCSLELMPNHLRRDAVAVLSVIRPFLRTTEPDKCPDCGADIIEVCSGLENIIRGDAASSCRHADYCEKPTKPVSVSLATLAQIAFESSGTAGMWVLVSDGMKDKYLLMTKAILDATGMKYVD